MRLFKKTQLLCLALLAGFGTSALAQSNHLFMPPDSKDIYFGGLVVNYACAQGGTQRCGAVLPVVLGQWSNGIFASINTVGLQMSDDPTMDFGPIVTLQTGQRRNDDASDRSNLSVEPGGYYSFMLAYNIYLNANILYGGGDDHNGVEVNMSADYGMRLASHHAFTISPGMTWSNGTYLQSTFGINQQQALNDGLPVYHTTAGIKNIYLTGNWYWEINNKFTLNTGLNFSRLMGSAAASPLVEQRNDNTIYTALSYHY
jgi:outer membrane scaffolding protein for murein synthesis (MipA/OmpV family)